MSRCFRFPPPGYEREHRPEDLALLKEVKNKEKKHKKEKKNKKRRKEKEKKEKDGSGERQRDKKERKGENKDKKEKHGDKKKEKEEEEEEEEDWGKDKEKSSISEESTIAGKLEERSGEKLHPKGHNKDSSVADEGRCSTFFQGKNVGKPSPRILPSQATKEAKSVMELNGRIRDDEKDRENLFPERVASVEKRDQEAVAGLALRNPLRVLGEDKINDRDKRVHIKKMETQRLDGEFAGKAMVENLTRMAKNEGIPRPVKDRNDWRLENKEKYKEAGYDMQGDKQNERDKKSHGKDRNNEKEKKKEEKAKLKIKNKKSEYEKSTNIGTNDLAVATNKSAKLLKDDRSTLNEANVRKRKDVDTNDFLHESEIRPNKVQSLALHQSTETGRMLEASHTSNKSSFNKHAVPSNVWSEHWDRLNNSISEAQKPSISKPNSSGTYMVTDQMAVDTKISHANKALIMPKMKDHIAEEAPRIPPHPDSMYLSKVLIVPKVEGWSDNDDQEWLFSKKSPPERPQLDLPGFKEQPHVWSEAVHIESSDIYALPYVIPY